MYQVKEFFDIVLKGESKTYDDHNWYISGNKLKGYIKGRSTNPYSLLNKNLSEYTLNEIIEFQSRPRDEVGQLWATGRYQIIPSTLKGLKNNLNLSGKEKYDEKLQDRLGLYLLLQRKNISNYLRGVVPDDKENLENAALEVSKIWSSVGVPFKMIGKYKEIEKNESYYSGGGDKASIPTESVQLALRKLRKSFIKDKNSNVDNKKNKKKIILLISITSISLVIFILSLYLYNKKYYVSKL